MGGCVDGTGVRRSCNCGGWLRMLAAADSGGLLRRSPDRTYHFDEEFPVCGAFCAPKAPAFSCPIPKALACD